MRGKKTADYIPKTLDASRKSSPAVQFPGLASQQHPTPNSIIINRGTRGN